MKTKESALAVKPSAGTSRRQFMQACGAAAAAAGLPAWAGERMAETLAAGRKPSLVWLHFQECTGCTESLLRTSHPDVASLLLDLVSLDHHETLFAAAGEQIEDALEKAKRKGGYVLVVEGAIPRRHRVDAYLSVYRPAPGWDYFPSLGETVVTVGMAAIGIAIFIAVSRLFPVVVVEEPAQPSLPIRRAAAGGRS